jgi:YHS domain-containing protein
MGNRNRSASDADGSSKTRNKPDSQVRDVLVEDPVCKSLVPRNQAVRLKHEGQLYYFCSEKCCDEFTDKNKRRKK